MKTFFLIVIIFFALIASFLLGRQSAGENASVRIVVVRDTVTDTIRSIRPVPVKTVIARHDTLRLPVIETRTDSVLVSLPVERKTYTDDSTYTAVVSGINPCLDSIEVYRRSVYETRTITHYTKPSRISIGLQGGYGYGRNGFSPYIGIGISYNLINIK